MNATLLQRTAGSNAIASALMVVMALVTAAAVVAGCATAPTETMPVTRAEDKAASPVVRETLPEPVVPAPVTATTNVPSPEGTGGAAGSTSTQGGTAAGSAAGASTGTMSSGSATAAAPAPNAASTTGAVARNDGASRKGTKSTKRVKGNAAPSLAMAAPGSAGQPQTTAAQTQGAQPAIPDGTLYVCSATVNGENQQTAIEFEPRVKTLCARHPEMGVCQYEREQCRSAGGRVYTPAGEEITRRTEAEYDKKVLRVRFKAG